MQEKLVLSQLEIRGLAIIDHVQVRFTPGFNVVTGETGAGKSILIKAIQVLLGAKVSGGDMVRHGCDQAIVCGTFTVNSRHRSLHVLEKLGIPCVLEAAEGTLLLRRSVTAKGRSQAWINDVPVTATSLRSVGVTLIDLFAQHENLQLLDESSHVHYLDAFLADPKVLAELQTAHAQAKSIVHRITGTLQQLALRRKTYDYYHFRRNELRTFNPSAADFNALKQFCADVETRTRQREKLIAVQGTLDQGGENGDTLSQVFRTCLRTLRPVAQLATIAPICARLEQIAQDVEDLSYRVNTALSQDAVEERDLEQAQARLAQYQDFFRKLGVATPEDLHRAWHEVEQECEFVDIAGERVLHDARELQQACERLKLTAQQLSAARLVAARTMERNAAREFKDLTLNTTKLKVEFLPNQPAVSNLAPDMASLGPEHARLWAECAMTLASIGTHGAERVTFLLATNPGEPLKPLHKIVSGGEASRIMLALKRALINDASTCILVFDEIDTGISGRVADQVGRKMRQLAHDVQVVAISHLPQVAAYAEQHLCVEKLVSGKKTHVTLRNLTSAERVTEIARLLSSDKVTALSSAHAAQLLASAVSSS